MPMNVIWEKLDRLCYPAMKTVWSYVVHLVFTQCRPVTDRQTLRQKCCS